MNAPDSPRVGIDVYLEWLQREAIPVTEDFGVDLQPFEIDIDADAWRIGCVHWS